MMGFTTLSSSPRTWMLFASLATRGAGFIVSFLIARIAGVAALGTYSALVNTTASVATPFAQVLTNNSTVLGSEAVRGHDENYRKHALSSLILALFLSCIAVFALIMLYKFIRSQNTTVTESMLAIGGFVVAGQLVGAVSLGFLYGAGEFITASRISIVAALVLCSAAYPVIYFFGFIGALVLLLFTSIFPPIVMATRVLARENYLTIQNTFSKVSAKEVLSRFVRALPTVAAISVNNGVNWFCTIFLVQSSFGSAGIGLVAVAGQWLNLMLIPATSWGGVSLKLLTDVINSPDLHLIWRTAYRLIRKNLAVTLALSGFVALFSDAIAHAYDLRNTDVALLICINAACALIASINNIFERFFLALDRQYWWLILSLASLSVQVIVTVAFISHGLWIVSLGVLFAGVILSFLSYIGIHKAISINRGKK